MDNLFGMGINITLNDLASNGLNGLINLFTRTQSTGQSMSETLTTSLNSLQNLSVSGAILSNMGGSIEGLGSRGIGILKQLGSQVIETGSKFETTRQTMTALYNSATIGLQKTQWAMNMAAKTPFQMEDLTSMMTRMKSVGIEADALYTDQKGQTQSLAQYIGDLASLHPEKGLAMTTQFIQELLELSPRGTMAMRSLGVSLETLQKAGAGNNWASTTEGRVQQLVKVSSYLANGLSSKLMGTWQGITSNMQDQITRIKLAISDAGAFDAVKATLLKISNFLGNLDSSKLQLLGKSIASAFATIWKPIDAVVTGIIKLVSWFENLAETNPKLAQIALTLFTIGSVTLVASGFVMKLVGGFMQLASSSLTAILVLQKLGGLGNLLSSAVGSIKAMTVTMLPYIAMAGLAYAAYRSNFVGIRDILQNFVNNSYQAFQSSASIADMSVDDMTKALDKLSKKNDFFSGLTIALVKIRVLFSSVVEAWNSNTLSTQSFEKARVLGLLPLIEAVLKTKERAKDFFKGFTQGAEEVKKAFKSMWDFLSPIFGFIFKGFTTVDTHSKTTVGSINNIKNATKGIDVQKWISFGSAVAKLGGLFLMWKIGSTIYGIGASIVSLAQNLATLGIEIGGVVIKYGLLAIAKAKDTFDTVFSIAKYLVLEGVIKAVTIAQYLWNLAMSLNPMGLIIAAIVAVVAIIVVLISHWTQVKETVANVVKSILNFIKPLTDVIGSVVGTIGKLFGFGGKKVDVQVNENKTSTDSSKSDSMVGLATGGYVTTTGMAVLHPNEVVVNDETTQDLKTFLGKQKSAPGFDSVNSNNRSTNTSVDNSITIEKGAIVIQSSGDTDKDIDSIVDKIEKKLKRRQQIKNMSSFQPV